MIRLLPALALCACVSPEPNYQPTPIEAKAIREMQQIEFELYLRETGR